MIISFCGHSNFSSTPQLKNKLMELLETKINGQQVEFYLGGYGGFDSFARSCCAEYKENHQNATLIFVTPYLGDYLNNRKDYIEKYYDTTIYPDIETTPKRYAIVKRNEWIVERSDLVIAYVQLHFGGAYHSLLHAKRKNKPYINLYDGNYELY